MPDYVRVRDDSTDIARDYTIVASALNEEFQTVLDEPAVNHNGDPLPATFHTKKAAETSGQPATTKKESL